MAHSRISIFGMYMISLGKIWMCQEIKKKILDRLLPKSDTHTFTLESSSLNRYDSSIIKKFSCVFPSNESSPLRKKTPITRNEDFLWA
jgi:hypothetical protein